MMTINKTIEKKNGFLLPGNPLGLYLHIPFCIKKCNYCDFLSFGGSKKEEQTDYIEALIRELEYYGKLYRNIYYVDSVFIGGGTPSLLESALMVRLITAIRENFRISENVEFTIESNPKTLTREKLDAYLDAGINRLSMGAQSLNTELLHFMGRIHSKEDVLANYQLARECGFKNINLDLIFAVPGQTLELWMDTLEKVIELKPEHISIYSLQLEAGTPFYRMFQEGSLKETSDELDRSMYHEALRCLKNSSYVHYEISNAAKEGYQCRHNLKYWSMDDYLGLGLGAHSYLEGLRFSNLTDLKRYIEVNPYGQAFHPEPSRVNVSPEDKIYDGITPSPFAEWVHVNSKEENISEYLFTGMRKMKGIDLNTFEKLFGMTLGSLYGDVLQKYQDQKLIEIADGRLYFTVKGIDISNSVLAEFV